MVKEDEDKRWKLDLNNYQYYFKLYDSHKDNRIKYPSSLKAQEDFIETEVAEDVLYKDLVAVFTPQVIALRLHTAGKK